MVGKHQLWTALVVKDRPRLEEEFLGLLPKLLEGKISRVNRSHCL